MEYICIHTYAYIHMHIYILNQSGQLYRFDCCVVFSPDPIHSARVSRLRLVAISCCLSSLLCCALDWRMRSSPFTWKRCVKAMATTMPINHMPGRQAAPTRSDPLSFGIGEVDLPRN